MVFLHLIAELGNVCLRKHTPVGLTVFRLSNGPLLYHELADGVAAWHLAVGILECEVYIIGGSLHTEQ